MRVWLFRSSILLCALAVGVAGWLTYRSTNADATRRNVSEQLQAQFPGLDVEVGSASLRLLGGISVQDVRLIRRDDPTNPVLVIPSATIFHDKEQLAQGRLLIRKIEMRDPVLLVRRDVEGNWNLAGLTQPHASGHSCPLIVVRHGTVIYEDRLAAVARPRLELRDAHWTVINDPQPVVRFQGRGQTPFGPVKWEASWQHTQGTCTGSIDFTDIHFRPALARDLGRHVPELLEHFADFAAQGDARLSFRYQANSRPALQPDLSVRLHHGHWRHPRLPLQHLEDLELSLRYRDEQITIERFQARSGATEVALKLVGMLPPAGLKLDDPQQLLSSLNLSVRNLSLAPELFARLPLSLQKVHKSFKPCGPIDVSYELTRTDHAWSKRCTIQPQGMTAEYEDFRYPLEQIRGTLVQVMTSAGTDRLDVDLTGQAAGQPLVITGSSEGDVPNNRLDLHVHGQGIPIHEPLLAALEEYRQPVDSFHPTGRFDFRMRIQRQPRDTRAETLIHLDFRDMTVRFDSFPYPLEEMAGTAHVTIGKHNRVEFENFRGRRHGGEVTINGTDDLGPAGSVLQLRIEAAGVPFDADLANAVGHLHLQGAWKALGPRGRLNLAARLTHIARAAPPNTPKGPSELDIVFERLHADTLLPDFLPYELNNVTTSGRFTGNRVAITELKGRHGASRLHIGPSVVMVKPGGGLWGQFQNIQLTPLIADEEFLCALPSGLRSLCATVEPAGPMDLAIGLAVVDLSAAAPEVDRQRLQVQRSDQHRTVRLSHESLADKDSAAPWIYWEDLSLKFAGATLKLGVRWKDVFGEIASRGEYRNGKVGAVIGNLDMAHATLFRQPFQNVHAHLLMNPARSPGVLQINNLKANIFGGNIAGQGRILFDSVVRYDLSLNALQVKMEDIARHNRLTSEQLSGRAHAQLYLSGQSGDVNTLRGGGTFDIPRGRIYNLPPLLDLLKFVKLHQPDGTFFEEAHTRFRIQGERVHFDQIDLLGNLVSLTGNGDMNLDGSRMKLEVYPIWSRVVQALPGPVRDGANAVSHGLYKIDMTGSLGGNLNYRPEAIPAITEPARRLMERMRLARDER